MAEAKPKSTFDILNAVNVSDHTEDKPTGNGKTMSYLSWAWAWSEVKKRCPDATYEIIKFDGIPYVFDPKTGYMVYTKVTINGITHEMWLPVMDSNNNAMKDVEYQVQTKYKTIAVKPATMFDINKTIMRCLTKNLAMFGLGLYIYAGEDLPEAPEDEQSKENASQKDRKASKTASKDKEVNQPIMELPSDYCTICRLPVMDWAGKTKNGTPIVYSKAEILEKSTAKFGSPICMDCMLKRSKKTRQQPKMINMDGEYQAIMNEDAGDRI